MRIVRLMTGITGDITHVFGGHHLRETSRLGGILFMATAAQRNDRWICGRAERVRLRWRKGLACCLVRYRQHLGAEDEDHNDRKAHDSSGLALSEGAESTAQTCGNKNYIHTQGIRVAGLDGECHLHRISMLAH